jgi:hypothetical protein
VAARFDGRRTLELLDGFQEHSPTANLHRIPAADGCRLRTLRGQMCPRLLFNRQAIVHLQLGQRNDNLARPRRMPNRGERQRGPGVWDDGSLALWLSPGVPAKGNLLPSPRSEATWLT